MSLDECIGSAVKASKGRITKERAKELMADMEKEIQANGTSYGEVVEILEESIKVNADQRLLRKYNAYQDALAVKKVANTFDATSIGHFKQSFRDQITRLEEAVKVETANIKGDLVTNLKKQDVYEIFKKQESPETLTKFMHQLKRGEQINIKQIPPEQQGLYKLAQVLNEHNDKLLKLQNGRGMAVNFLEGRIARNYWSADKIHYAKVDEFVKDMTESVDWSKTDTKGLSVDAYLREKFENFSSGLFGKAEDDILTGDIAKGGVRERVQASMMARRGKARSLHVKPEAHHKIMTKYGHGDIYATIEREMAEVGRDMAHLVELGSKPREILEAGLEEFKLNNKTAQVGPERHFADDPIVTGSINNLFGDAEVPANKMAARINNSFRKFMSSLSLGNVALTSAADLATNGLRSAMIKNGSNTSRQVATVANSLAEQFKQMVGIYGDETAKRMWSVALEELDDMAYADLSGMRYSDLMNVDDASGRLNHTPTYKTLNFIDKAHDMAFKYTGLQRYTEQRIANVYPSIGHDFATIAQKAKLDDFDKQFLKELQIEDMWDLMRSKIYTDAESGKGYMLTEAFDDLSDADIASLPNAPDSEFGRAKLKSELKSRYRTAFAQEARKRVIIPGAVTQSKLSMGRRGTFLGEFTRNAAQFKSFPVELYSQLLAPAIRNGQLGAVGTYLAAASSLFMIRNWTLDLVQGKTPRDMTFNPESPEIFAKNWTGLMAGVIGFPVLDQIIPAYIGEGADTKRTWADAIAGPGNTAIINTISDVFKVGKNVAEGDTDKATGIALKSASKAPIIGPALYGNFFTKNILGHWYNAFFATFDPDYDSKIEKYAQQQGSRYYNISRDGELDDFIEDVSTPFE